ncbi:aspartate-semialdehyde dehydrogenase [Pseudomonas typographi]|uniref:Aspartate-semialdehyde dehydrogenase n=1 Tax=Pseudomonas typographi TaxID=2715964 RepID=A0ABR7Z6S5_9PSED|nr:aspartate-semialdehyde dehydrogenase [Pseudomonas typographi]MBD1553830.1 aspartate-semialdehyde dehydrogenase [Pseudomonas typographi]MBD1588524.1 aspartate-semialdehyde dehydrogenase [Pseudomonas typographi]MBD1601226.1 aspartate-semialdehyde dehydrogenase [Pseudomonas typographi]
MLAPITPVVHVPINPQLDPAKPTPDIPPVAASQAVSGDNQVDLRQPEQQDGALLRDEQRRRQRHSGAPTEPLVLPGEELNADDTVPAVALVEGEERQGQWIDLKV